MKPRREADKDIQHIKEYCGHEGDYDFNCIVPWHFNEYIREKIEVEGKFFDRIFCPICHTYWEVEYKKITIQEENFDK